jgi:hypothetical protein
MARLVTLVQSRRGGYYARRAAEGFQGCGMPVYAQLAQRGSGAGD